MQGRRLALSRERAAVATSRGVHLLDPQPHGGTMHVELARIVDVAAVGDELWVAAGRPALLHRLRADGTTIGAPLALGDDDGVLRPVAVGAPGAVWAGARERMVTAAGVTELAGEVDCAIPVSTTRWVSCRRDRVTLHEATNPRWSVANAILGGRAVDGAVLFGGRAVAIVAARERTPSQIVIANLHDGSIVHRITLTDVRQVRFAAARGMALLVSGMHGLLLIDLRFGHVVKHHLEAKPIDEAAIDVAAQIFLVRFTDGDDAIAFGAVKDLDGEPRLIAPPGSEAVAEPQPAPAGPPPPLEAPVETEFHRDHAPLVVAHALAVRPEPERCDEASARRLLEHYRTLVASLLGRAIAVAWDRGRIAFPNEGALPYLHEVRGILGRSGGRAASEIAETEAQVLHATAELRKLEAQTAGQPPLETIAIEYGLSPLARLLLLLIAGPTLWGELARLYGILGNDERRPLVDEMLLVQILDGQVDRQVIARELDRDAPLVHHGIVRIGAGRSRPFLDLSVEPIVQCLLQSADTATALAAIELYPPRPFDELLIPRSIKTAIVAAMQEPHRAARVVMRGRSGSGRHTVLAALARSAHRRVGVIDAGPIVRDASARIGQLRSALYRAHLLGLMPCIDNLELLATDDRSSRELVAQVLDGHPGPLAIRLPWDAEPPLRPGYIAIDLPALTIDQRTACWRLIAQAHGLTLRSPEELAERFSVGPGIIHRACTQIGAAGGEADQAVPLERAIRQHLGTQIRATATRVERLAPWSRVVLPPDIQETVLELIARIKHRRIVFDTWGFDQVLTTARGVTALFQGGPGTGKTLVASAIANELGMDLYRVDLSRVMSKWIGETEQNLAKLFDAAEDGHAIILFDEADSLFAKRTEVRTSVDRYANLEVNYLLQRLDSFEGIAILTTNFGTSIDGAFKRRLSFRLTFPFPDEEGREALWRAHIPPNLPTAGALDFGALARRYQVSGGYIRNATLRAAFLAAEEHVALTQEHLERAIKAEFRELGRIAEGGVLQ